MTSALHALRAPPLDFTGRKQELAELLAKMGEGGVTISALQGQGGVGKTALALKIAEALKPRYPDGQIDLDLRGASQAPMSAAAVMAHVIHAFEPTARLPEGEAALGGIYRTVLHGKRALLLFDNARDRAQVEPLLPPAGSVMIVTSRQSFHLSGLVARHLDELDPADAIALLRRTAPRLSLRWAAEIAGLCGRLPLALCLAGSALAEQEDLEAEEFVERLKSATERIGLIEGSLGLSFALLDARLQVFWSCLGVFPSDFDREAAAAVGKLEPTAARRALGDLLKHSMIDYDRETKRYRLHDLSRLYAVSQLGETEQYRASLQHATYFKGVLVAADELYKKGGASIAIGLVLFDRERANVEAGQAWAAAHASADDAAAGMCDDYPDAGAYYLALRQHPRDRIRWREAALAAARRLGRLGAEGVHFGHMGVAHRNLGEPHRSIELFEQQRTISREIGDRGGEGNALGGMGLSYGDLGEPRRAIELHEQHLTITREIGDCRGEGQALANMGRAYTALGEPRRAIDIFEQRLAMAREISDRRGEGRATWNMGQAYAALGDTRRAIELYGQCLIIAREIGDRRGEAMMSWSLGEVHDRLDELEKAVALMQIYVDFLRDIGHADAEKYATHVDKVHDRLKG